MTDPEKIAKEFYGLEEFEYRPVPGHEGGRNRILICVRDGERKYVLRVSGLGDRTEEDYLAETEFVRYLASNGAPVADVIPSARGRLVERLREEGQDVFVSLFRYAGGMLMSDHGYRWRDGAPLEEYFFNTGKALGAIHRLSRQYRPVHRRPDFFAKYNMEVLGRLIPDGWAELKQAIARRLEAFRTLPADGEAYGLVHFDFCDGNYHVDFSTGDLTVFDFDNCVYCWYMFDLAHLWTHGVGWYRHLRDPKQRMEGMKHYFDTVLEGYRTETDVPGELLEKLPLFIDMTLIENVADEFECAAREGELPDPEDIGDLVRCLVDDVPYAGFGDLNPAG